MTYGFVVKKGGATRYHGQEDPAEDKKRKYRRLDEWYSLSDVARTKIASELLDDRVKRTRRMEDLYGQVADWTRNTVGAEKGATDGRKMMTVHRIGDTYERRMLDPISRQWVTVATAKANKGMNAGTTVTSVLGKPPGRATPEDVAAVFGIPFKSPFEDQVAPPMTTGELVEYNKYRKRKGLKEVPVPGTEKPSGEGTEKPSGEGTEKPSEDKGKNKNKGAEGGK